MCRTGSITPFTYRIISATMLLVAFFNLHASHSLYFSNLTTRNGLSSNITNSIVQDKHGFIWIGTQEGLCRYDGFRMINFQHTLSEGSLSSNNISTLLYDDDYIWVGTWEGLNRINIHTFAIQRVFTGHLSGAIRALYKDRQGDVWIGTSNGVFVYEKSDNQLKSYNTQNSLLSHNTIRSFYQARNGEMWIGTYDGLNRYQNGHFSTYNLKGNYMPLLENNLIVSIQPLTPAADTLLWVGTETGLARFDTRNGRYTLYNTSNTQLSNEVIKSIYHQNDSLLWLGTDFGLNIFNTRSLAVETYYHDPLIEHSLASNVIWEIFEDRQQRLWFITSNGVSISDKQQPHYQFYEQYFSREPLRIGNQVKDILVATSGQTWLATIHGVVAIDPAGGKQQTFSTISPANERLLLNNVYALMEDEKGRILIGTAGGINIWDPTQKRMFAITANRENGLLSNYISGFAFDPEGNLWVTAWEGGLFKAHRPSQNPEQWYFELADSNGDGRLTSTHSHLYYANMNTLWRVNPQTLEKTPVETANQALQGKQISAMMAASNGALWLGALQEIIIYHPDNDTIINLNIHTGRPQKIINLQQDTLGNVWATTSDAIIRIEAQNLAQMLIPVNRNSPLKGFYHFCSASDPNGRVLFGGDNGFIAISPDIAISRGSTPNVYITSLFINNQQIHPADSLTPQNQDIAFVEKLRLRHNQNSLTFEFSTLDYLFPEFVQFQYRMLPFQEEWTLTSGEKNFAVFANLKPGQYTFQIKGSDRSGEWSEVRSVQVRIIPSIWLAPITLLLYFLVVLSAGVYAYRVYRNRRRLRNELQLIRLEKQHNEALYQAKIRFFTNISHEFRTPLSLILPPIHELLKENSGKPNHEKMLKLAQRNAQRLYKLVNQLLDFRKIEAEKLELAPSALDMVDFCRDIFNSFDDMAARNETEYLFLTSVDSLSMEIDREKAETIIFNLLSNAFKYTPVNGQISLSLKTIEPPEGPMQLEIAVKDNGIGISEEEQKHIFKEFYQTAESRSLKKGSGIGLTLAQEYARLHKGHITVASQPGKGSEFTWVLPIPETHAQEIASTGNSVVYSGQKQGNEPVSAPAGAKKILVVDDNEDILELVELNLRDQYQVFLARNGAQGLEKAETLQPDLILSDVMMPVMDGIELCRQIKSNRATMHIPVILLTARSLDMHKTEGLTEGADMYLTKPFDMDVLKSSLLSLFRRQDLLTQYIRTDLILKPLQEADTDRNQDELFLKKVITLIENHMANPDLSVELIAASLGMSATHLYRKLKENTGYSTKEIIMNYRMQKAAQMIRNNEGNISEIMYAVGFSSLAGFSRSFKAKFGVAPSAFLSQAEPGKQG